MLAHRLRLWANIKSTLVHRVVFAGDPHAWVHSDFAPRMEAARTSHLGDRVRP